MASRLYVEFSEIELRAIADLLIRYGEAMAIAAEGLKKPKDKDGMKTIHLGLKTTRKLLKEFLGENQIPDDSEFDAIVKLKLVDSGLAPNYDVTNARDLKPKQILNQARKVAEAQIAYETGKRKRKSQGD